METETTQTNIKPNTQKNIQNNVEPLAKRNRLFIAKWCILISLGIFDYITDIIAATRFMKNEFFVCDYCAPNTLVAGVFLVILSTIGFILSLYGKYKQCIKQRAKSNDDDEPTIFKMRSSELRTLLKILLEDIPSILIILIVSVDLGQFSWFYMVSLILSLTTMTAEILFEFKRKGLLFSTIMIIILLPTFFAITEKTFSVDIHAISVNNKCYDYYTSDSNTANAQRFDINVDYYSNITNMDLIYKFNCEVNPIKDDDFFSGNFQCQWEFDQYPYGYVGCHVDMSIDDECDQIPVDKYCSISNNNSIYSINYIQKGTVFDFCELRCEFQEDINEGMGIFYRIAVFLCVTLLGLICLYGMYCWVIFCKNGCDLNLL